ncbi:hypothetical protein HHI36_014540 [Cryptolaemus montrouzieri]|uniref:Uncharacterized protein n=1 Tax=Cryptolaemus montrouzieri TaxID=559131 RepID=A0ABD2N339_9CUCU
MVDINISGRSMFVSAILLCVASTLLVFGNCEEEKICPFLAACIKETDGQVTNEEIKGVTLKNAEDIPEKILCVFKCAMDKRKFIMDDGKIDVDKAAANMKDKIEDIDGYKDCMKDIEIKNCGDMKKIGKCYEKFFKNP